jgi:hypothetical protein
MSALGLTAISLLLGAGHSAGSAIRLFCERISSRDLHRSARLARVDDLAVSCSQIRLPCDSIRLLFERVNPKLQLCS